MSEAILGHPTLLRSLQEGPIKSASPLLFGLAGHLATNALGRHAHHTSNLADVMAHRGFQAGARGSSMSNMASRSMEALLGPEAGINYQAAHAAGKALYAMPPAERQQALKQIASGQDILKHLPPTVGGQAINPKALEHAPVLGSLQRAVQHDIAGTAPTFEAKGLMSRMYGKAVQGLTGIEKHPFQTPTQRAVAEIGGALPLAGLAAADPGGAVVHAGWNTARGVVGRSQLGVDMQKRMFQQGIEQGMPSATSQLVQDIGISPAFLDARRAGSALRDAGVTPELVDHARQNIPIPAVRQAIQSAAGPQHATAVNSALNTAGALLPRPAAQRGPSSGGLGGLFSGLKQRFSRATPAAPAPQPIR